MVEWIIIGLVLVGLFLLGLAILLLVSKGRGFRKNGELNYRALYFIGISWLGIGTVFMMIYAATDLFPFPWESLSSALA